MIAPSTGYAMGGASSALWPATCGCARNTPKCAARTVCWIATGRLRHADPALAGRRGWAKRMILTNERVNAETALRIGLVEQVCPAARGLA